MDATLINHGKSSDASKAGTLRFALSTETVQIVLDALARLRATELNDMQLGPGSQRRVNAVARAEMELRDQLSVEAST